MIRPIEEITNSIEDMLRELQESWYAEGYTDGYNKAMSKLAGVGSSADDLRELEEEVSE